jgi:hypothetical protein
MLRFPLPNQGWLKPWMIRHLITQAILFGVLFVLFDFYIACLSGFYYPLRAVIWKGWLGYDPNDELNDIVWGAAVPALIVFAILLLFGANR